MDSIARYRGGKARRARFAFLAPLLIATACATLPKQIGIDASAPRAGGDENRASAVEPALSRKLMAILDEAARAEKIPGLQAAVVLEDGTSWTGASGNVDPRGRTPLKSGDAMRIASITKTFVAVIILQLAAEGALSLDDRLSRWLPGFPRGDRISVRQLLDHSSGVGDHDASIEARVRSGILPTAAWTRKRLLAMASSARPFFEPGSDHRYSNTDYLLLGLIAERASGRPATDLLRERISGPLGLARTSFAPEDARALEPVNGYDRKYIPFPPGTHVIAPANASWASLWLFSGNIVSTAQDVLAFYHALFRGSLVSPEALRSMTEFSASSTPGSFRYGKGLQEIIVDGERFWGHMGNFVGFESLALYSPEKGFTVVLIGNSSAFDRMRVFAALKDAIEGKG